MNTASTPTLPVALHTCWHGDDDIFYYTLKLTTEQIIEIAVITDIYFRSDIPTTKHILSEAHHRGFVQPDTQLTGILLGTFSAEDVYHMCLLRAVIMRKPIPSRIRQDHECIQLLLQKHLDLSHQWDQGTGFIFVIPHQ